MTQLLHPDDHVAKHSALTVNLLGVTGGSLFLPWDSDRFDLSEEPEDGCLDAPERIPAGSCESFDSPLSYFGHVTFPTMCWREYEGGAA
jgi:hypothetical protein